eukprot:gene1601-978_t
MSDMNSVGREADIPARADYMADMRASLMNSVDAGLLTREAAAEILAKAYTAHLQVGLTSYNEEGASAHLAEQTELKMYPFKVPQKQARKFRETCPENLNTFKHRFDMLCKEGDITPLTSLICYYLLYSASAEVGMRHLLHILLYADEGRRTSLFNWEVIEGLDEATQNLYGPYIEKLPVPLIPGEAGAVKNGIIIRRFREAETALLQGGSADEDITNGMYRGYLEPVMNPQGEQVLSINMEGTEGRLTTLYHGLQNIFEGQARMQQQLNAEEAQTAAAAVALAQREVEDAEAMGVGAAPVQAGPATVVRRRRAFPLTRVTLQKTEDACFIPCAHAISSGGNADIPALEAVFRKVESQDAACGNRGLRGFLTGYALANIADDRDRSLTVGALANRRTRGGWISGEDVPVVEVLRSLSYNVMNPDQLQPEHNAPFAFLARETEDEPLPAQRLDFSFLDPTEDNGQDFTLLGMRPRQKSVFIFGINNGTGRASNMLTPSVFPLASDVEQSRQMPQANQQQHAPDTGVVAPEEVEANLLVAMRSIAVSLASMRSIAVSLACTPLLLLLSFHQG